jgi:catechol 2,3-dioxygenase-like lactoylglutathione lyase family enzyme
MIIAGRLDHFAIAAADTQGMVNWYARVLGLVVHAEGAPPAGATQKVFLIGPPLPAGGVTRGIQQGMMIEVMPKNDTPRHERNSHEPGLSHAAWYVKDFDASLQHLRNCGVRFVSEVIQAVGGGRIISFLDCEGNMMQIVERK